MVYLKIDLEIFIQSVMTQEAYYRCCIIVVLVLRWLHRFRFDEESSFKTLLACIVFGGVQKPRQVLLFTFHVCVKQSHVAFASTPEYIVLPTQSNGGIKRCFYLGSRMC